MRGAYYCLLIFFVLILGCAQKTQTTYGFPGKHQDTFQPVSRDYDQREQVDDDTLDFTNGNFDPDPDVGYF
jgi:hypothetical protein